MPTSAAAVRHEPDPDSATGRAYAWLKEHPHATNAEARAAGFSNTAILFHARHWLTRGRAYEPPADRKARKPRVKAQPRARSPIVAQGLPVSPTTLKALRSLANLTGVRAFTFEDAGVEVSIRLR